PRSVGRVTSRRCDPRSSASHRRVESARALPTARAREEQAVDLGFDAAATAMGTASTSARVQARTTAIRGVLLCACSDPVLALDRRPAVDAQSGATRTTDLGGGCSRDFSVGEHSTWNVALCY
ncbi:unnamed protein product, partial [Urochloa humidicola]